MSDDNVFRLYPKPADAPLPAIDNLYDLAVQLMKADAKRLLEADNTLWPDGPVLPSTVPELMFSTKKRHLPDIYECRKCQYQFPQEASCPECGSTDMGLFMRAPSRSELRVGSDHEAELDEIDPDWREHFGDAERAMDFYKPRGGYVVHSSPFEPDTIADKPIYREEDE